MDRRSLIVLALAALAVAAIGLSAATLTSTVSPSDGQGAETDNETADADAMPSGPSMSPETEPGSGAPPLFQRLMMVLGGLMLLGALGYAVLNPSRATTLAVILLGFLLVVSLLIVVAGPTETSPGEPPEQSQQQEQQNTSGGNPGSGGDSDVLYDIPVVWWFLGSFAVLILGVILVLRRYGLRSDEDSNGEPSESTEETTALGAIAGQAADRIEDRENSGPNADNEVYRAWEEMTAQLDIESGETTTPREFEQQATAAGMAPDDVRELTDLFEMVRYGGETATEDREQRAVSVLRRIESTYGGER